MVNSICSIPKFAAGFIIGEVIPDLDQKVDFLNHRSALTHSVLPILAFNNANSALKKGVAFGTAAHLCLDLFPKNMNFVGTANVQVPVLGSLGSTGSIIFLGTNALLSSALASSKGQQVTKEEKNMLYLLVPYYCIKEFMNGYGLLNVPNIIAGYFTFKLIQTLTSSDNIVESSDKNFPEIKTPLGNILSKLCYGINQCGSLTMGCIKSFKNFFVNKNDGFLNYDESLTEDGFAIINRTEKKISDLELDNLCLEELYHDSNAYKEKCFMKKLNDAEIDMDLDSLKQIFYKKALSRFSLEKEFSLQQLEMSVQKEIEILQSSFYLPSQMKNLIADYQRLYPLAIKD